MVPCVRTSLTPGKAAKAEASTGRGENQRHSLAPLLQERVGGLQSCEAAAPHDCDAVAHPLHLAKDVRREEYCPALGPGLPEELKEGVLHQRVEACRRLVQYGENRLVEHGLHEADLLPVASAQAPGREIKVDAQAFGEPVRRSQIPHAAQSREVPQQLAPGHADVESELAW